MKTILLSLLLLSLCVSASFAAIEYEIIDLGKLIDDADGAFSINNNGQIVGSFGGVNACLFDSTGNGNNVYLGTLGGNKSKAYSISDNGLIAGSAYLQSGFPHACLFDSTGNGGNIDIGTLGTDSSYACSVNNDGQVVGCAYYGGRTRAFFYENGSIRNLGSLGVNDSSIAFSINNDGQIVGKALTESRQGHACLFDPISSSNNIDLGTLRQNGGGHSTAYSNNSIGQIVGRADTDLGGWHACLFDSTGNGNNIDLGALGGTVSRATSINDIGQIVGESNLSDWSWRACLFDPTGSGNNIDLNTLIDPTSGWTLKYTYDINSSGQIVGSGSIGGETHAYLLIPVPEPISLDIKPGSCPNPVNVKSKGILPVAILGTEEFEVSTIDPASIFLNSVPAIRSSYEDVAGPVANRNECECTTDGPDGFMDLTLKFRTQEIVEALGEVNHGDVLTLSLTGVLDDETPIEGTDCIVIRGKHKPLNKADINKDGIVNAVDMAIVAENWLQSSIVE